MGRLCCFLALGLSMDQILTILVTIGKVENVIKQRLRYRKLELNSDLIYSIYINQPFIKLIL